MSLFSPRMDILPPAQREIWPLLRPGVELGLVLYGGTAVALRLGHRESVDFDFFTDKQLSQEQLRRSYSFLNSSTTIQSEPDTLSVLVPVRGETVKLSFFGSITIGRVGIPERTPDGVLEVASSLDLLATKLKVLLQRVEAKDYQDIAAILRSGQPLELGLAAAAELYAPTFQPSEAVKALTYFEGGDVAKLSDRDKSLLIRAVSGLRRVPMLGRTSRSLSSQS